MKMGRGFAGKVSIFLVVLLIAISAGIFFSCGGGGSDTGDIGGGSDALAVKVDITSEMYSQSSAYTLNGTVDPAVTSASISLNGAAVQNVAISENAFSIPITLNSGYNTIAISTTDSSGATGTTVYYITYDTGQPSSIDLINSALNAGAITSEGALIYKTYAAFNDTRLPAQYKGDDSLADYSTITWEINEAYPTLSEAAKATLTPFLIPPYYKGSWHDIQKNAAPSSKSNYRKSKAVFSATEFKSCENSENIASEDWTWVEGVGSFNHVRVWYLNKYHATDSSKANSLITFLETNAWKKLTSLMGREPLSDKDMRCNGGNGKLDIALVDNLNAPGQTVVLESTFAGYGAEETPVYILINRNVDSNSIDPIATHEFMHAIQYGINVKSSSLNNDYMTLMESTADWAAYYILNKTMHKNNKWWQTSLSCSDSFMKNPDKPYDTTALNAFPYSESLLALYLSETVGDDSIKKIWDATQSYDQINSIDKTVSGGLKAVWPKYASANVNESPVNYYQQWDNVTQKVKKVSKNVTVGKCDDTESYMAVALPYLSSQYYSYTFGGDVRKVVFHNGLSYKLIKESKKDGESFIHENLTEDQKKGANVQAMIKRYGQWEGPMDWTLIPSMSFDIQSQGIEEIIIIFSNSDFEDKGRILRPQGLNPVFWAEREGEDDSNCPSRSPSNGGLLQRLINKFNGGL